MLKFVFVEERDGLSG